MKIQVVRIIDNVVMFDMVVASTPEELERGLLSADDALEIAYDIVHTAGECYDTGSSPWKVVIGDDVAFQSRPVAMTPIRITEAPAALLVGKAANTLRGLRESGVVGDDLVQILDEVELELERVLDMMGVVTYGEKTDGR